MTSPDLADANIDKLAELFPSIVTETLDAEGNPRKAIDFDLLRQELSDHVVEGPQERYQLDWPGKRAAAFVANAPIAKALRPVREESVDFDTTQNLFIEGDNLDALKLLQESYLGKVKLIYIDPPYNTGNDFVYMDDFSERAEAFLSRSGQIDDGGNKLVANPQSNGRFHSDWLSMMYPRLRLARNLLTDDGALLASIDDGESAALKLLLDEVFGASNYIGTFIWKSRQNVDSRNTTNLSNDHEYVHAYARNKERYALTGQDIDQGKYTNPDGDPRGPWMSNNILGLADATRRPNLHYDVTDPATGRVFSPSVDSGWRYAKETMAAKIAEGRILFPTKDGGRPREKLFMRELRTLKTGVSSILGADAGHTLNGTREVRELLGGKYFDFPKPVSLMSFLIMQVAQDPDAIVLDFFAGSGTTAHALMAINAIDGGTRRFIVVQLPEATDPTSEAAKQGYVSIAELSRERIRRAGRAVVDKAGLAPEGADVGFRNLRIDSSNMADVLRTPDDTSQETLSGLEASVKPDRSGEDLLFQVLLDWGLELTMPIRAERVEGRDVFIVEDDALIACFDSQVSAELVRAIAKREPLRAVFRDSGFASDGARINAEQVFREISPATDVKAI